MADQLAMGKPSLEQGIIDMKEPDEQAESELRAFFRKLDLDNDGKIDKGFEVSERFVSAQIALWTEELRVFLGKVGDVALRSEDSSAFLHETCNETKKETVNNFYRFHEQNVFIYWDYHANWCHLGNGLS